MPTSRNRNNANPKPDLDDATEEADSSPFSAVSFSGNMLYWTRLLETSYNRAFVAEASSPTSVSIWRVLAWLSEKEALTVGELALHTHMERTVLGRLLDRMADQGLIARTASEGDRRISMTRILAKGRKVFAKMQPVRDSIYERTIRGIDPAEVETARRVIVQMVKNLNESNTADESAARSTRKTSRKVR